MKSRARPLLPIAKTTGLALAPTGAWSTFAKFAGNRARRCIDRRRTTSGSIRAADVLAEHGNPLVRRPPRSLKHLPRNEIYGYPAQGIDDIVLLHEHGRDDDENARGREGETMNTGRGRPANLPAVALPREGARNLDWVRS